MIVKNCYIINQQLNFLLKQTYVSNCSTLIFVIIIIIIIIVKQYLDGCIHIILKIDGRKKERKKKKKKHQLDRSLSISTLFFFSA
jgi:ATP/ADP translocase